MLDVVNPFLIGIPILIGMFIAFYFIIESKSRPSSEEIQKSYSYVINDVIFLLERLQKFCKKMPDLGHLVEFVPVDIYGNLFGSDNRPPKRIQVSLLVDNEYVLTIHDLDLCAEEAETDNTFQLVKDEHCTLYSASSASTFKGKYKKFMPVLYKALRERFPEINFEINSDNSRITYHFF